MLFLVILFINMAVFAKYTFDATYKVAQIDIDRNPPQVELIKISNTNTSYENYANKTHTVTAQIKVTEKNIIENKFNKENVKILINKKEVIPEIYEIKEISRKDGEIIYEIKLGKLSGDGALEIKINEGTIKDKSLNVNQEKIINTNIKVDNTAPITKFTETESTQGKVIANVTSNEQLRNIEGWNLSSSKLILSKEFTNNISYVFEVMDFAQNKTQVEVNITKATNISIVYASHNSEVGWTFGYGNYDVAGKTAVKANPLWKTESLAFNVSGNISPDFIQAQAFVYSYWGAGSQATCDTYGTRYRYGYNPSESTFDSMASGTHVTINSRKYFMFGGSGINAKDKTDINGRNPISAQYEGKYCFGISGIKMRLKDTSYYSVVYQILVNNQGWLKAASDGETTMYRYDRPMSAYRMALVPKTEKQYIINLWNKDVGTYNCK